MSAPLLSPSKVRKGEFGCYQACLTFPVEVSAEFATYRVGKMNVKSAVGASFVDKDILAPSLNTNKVHYHIFDPTKYAPSENLKELEMILSLLANRMVAANLHLRLYRYGALKEYPIGRLSYSNVAPQLLQERHHPMMETQVQVMGTSLPVLMVQGIFIVDQGGTKL